MVTDQNLISLLCSSLFILSLLCFSQTCNARNCTPSSCGRIHNISSPFRLNNDPINCGDPEYELVCENDVVSVYLNSRTYHVKSIDYNYFTIRVTDAAINTSICSFPKLFAFDLEDPRLSFGVGVRPIYLISCRHPLRNSSLFTQLTACPNAGYTYVKVGNMLIKDMDNMCTLDAVTATSWNFTDSNNVSLSDIHQSLLYGFDLSWFALRRNCAASDGSVTSRGLFFCHEHRRSRLYYNWGTNDFVNFNAWLYIC